MKYINSVLLIFMLFISCKTSTNKDSEVIVFNIDLKANNKLSDFFESYYHVPLETREDNLIGDIDRIQFTNNRIYILTKKLNTVFIFDNDGKYINKINKQGRGPEEYLAIKDFDIYNSDLYVLSRVNKKVFVYTEEGNFINEYPLNDWYNNLKILDDNLIYLYSERSNNQYYNFVLYDYQKNKYIKKFDSFKENESFGFNKIPFHLTNNRDLLVCQPFEHIIYNLGVNSYQPKYKLSFNSPDFIPEEFKKIHFSDLVEKLRFKHVVKHILFIDEIDDNLFTIYSYFSEIGGDSPHLSRIKTKSNSISTIHLSKELDSKFPFITSTPVAMQDGFIVTASPAFRILEREKIHNFGIFSEENLKPDGNPVLFFHKLKQ